MLCDVEELILEGALLGDKLLIRSLNVFEQVMKSVVLGLILSVLLAGMLDITPELRFFVYLWARVGFVLFCLFLWMDSMNRRLYKERVQKIKVLLQENPELLPILKGKVSIPPEIVNPEGGAQ